MELDQQSFRPIVLLVAAVGRNGELGLSGQIPWDDPEDRAYFRRCCTDATVIVGKRTAATLPKLPEATRVHVQHSEESPESILFQYPNTLRFVIAGGAAVYASWLQSGLVTRSIITHARYEGPADAIMPSLWNDQLPAIAENVKIVDFLQTCKTQALRAGQTHSVRFYQGLIASILEVRHRKWPWLPT